MTGIFDITSAAELFRKLEADFAELQHDPRDSRAAFNFFVTAESLLDWVHPGRANKSKREDERNSNVLLQITSHLATGGKHFRVEAAHHTSVKSTAKTGGMYSAGMYRADIYKAGIYSKGRLLVELEGEAARQYGQSISAFDLASDVLEYWRDRTSGGVAPVDG